MKVVSRQINAKLGSGTAKLIPEEAEDLWHLYNLILAGDVVRAAAIRKVTDTVAATGASTTRTVRATLSVRVKKTEYDAGGGQLHVFGVVCAENPYTKMGQHHTLDIELNRQVALTKGEVESVGGPDDDSAATATHGGWDSVALDILREASSVRTHAETYAVVMEEGLANICVITAHQTIVRVRIERAIPKKRTGVGADDHDKGVAKFFEVTLQSLLRQLDLPALQADGKKPPPLVLASAGFTAHGFQKHMADYAFRAGDKALAAYVRDQSLVVHTTSGHVHSLSEALRAPAVLAKLSDTRFAHESRTVDKFLDLVRKDDGWAWYGPKEVERAVDHGAVGRGGGVLLISNSLFRSADVAQRSRWVALVDKVRTKDGGEVLVLSSAHESGKKLQTLGDIGAILTFPLLDLDEDGVKDGAEHDCDHNDEVPMDRNHDRDEAIDV